GHDRRHRPTGAGSSCMPTTSCKQIVGSTWTSLSAAVATTLHGAHCDDEIAHEPHAGPKPRRYRASRTRAILCRVRRSSVRGRNVSRATTQDDTPRGRLAGEVVLITGGARGIGRAIVETALRDGARVIAADIDEDAGAQLVREAAAGTNLFFRPVDVTEQASVAELVREIENELG